IPEMIQKAAIPCRRITVFDEESFSPVAAVLRARDPAGAVRLANRSKYGLAASTWTGDCRSSEDLAGAVEVGVVLFKTGWVKQGDSWQRESFAVRQSSPPARG